jgi:hypothetical protein
MPEMFLLAVAILPSLGDASSGFVVYPQRINTRVQEEFPFLMTESIIMKLIATRGVETGVSHSANLSIQCEQVPTNKSVFSHTRPASLDECDAIAQVLIISLDPFIMTNARILIKERSPRPGSQRSKTRSEL